VTRRLSQSIGDAGITRYLSFIVGIVFGGFSPPERFGVILNGTNGVGLFVGRPDKNSGNWVLDNAAGGSQVVGPGLPPTGGSHRLVVKCEFFAGNDRFTLYVDPIPGQPEPASGTVKFNSDVTTITNIAFTASNTLGQIGFDDLRLASSWAGALPNCSLVTMSPAALPQAFVGSSFSQILTASGGIAPYTFAVTGTPLPSWLILGPFGNLTGIPTAAGNYSFTILATDAENCSTFRNYSLTVNPIPSLAVTTSGGSPVFCWPTNASSFGLEYADSLAPPITWHTVTSGISVVGTNDCYTVAPDASVHGRFYRLHLP
jgi:hypothetical protein